MKNVRRIKRMSRGQKRKIPPLNLVSLMDVFTILVFFLLVNSANTEELSKPKDLTLPSSVSEKKPEQTVVVMVTPDQVLLRGEPIMTTADVLAADGSVVVQIQRAMEGELAKVSSALVDKEGRSREVTIMGDRIVQFKVLKKVMASCTAAGYSKISLAVIQKAKEG